MNQYFKVTTTDCKLSPWVWGEDRDTRTDAEKLREACENHIANAEKVQSFNGKVCRENEDEARAACDAKDESEALLIRLVEDIALVPYDLLAKAMAI
jgi:hypothetical protein